MTLIFLAAGLVLVLSELAVPSLVALFLGVAALLVAGLRFVGLVDGLLVSLFLWSALSVGLFVPLRPLLKKYLPAERHYDPSDEDKAAFGAVVPVLETITSDGTSGRIRHGGSTWSATCIEGRIEKGQMARLVHRDKLAWIVEPAVGELPPGEGS